MAMSRNAERTKTKGDLLYFTSRRGRFVALASLLVVAACLTAGAATAKTTHAASGLTIFAGSSMTSVLPEVDAGNTYSFGSTGTLATQITNGAPADLLMGANTATCSSLFASGVAEKPVNFTRNTLEAVVPKANPAGIKSIYDLTKPGIKVDEAASTVPVGSYTVQVLNQMGLNTAVQANVVSQETSDANVVAKVALGQVDAGFVYLSDYVINPTQLTLIPVPAWAQPKITYSMCVMTKSANQAAATAWVNKILSPAGQAIFVKDGFLPLTSPVPAITKLAPKSASHGATVTITGTNFKGTTSVTFHGVPAKFKVVSATKITLTVPAKAKTGSLSVTNPSGTATWKSYTIA
jgi:molybdate transport system substrate-binding protein